MVNGERRMRLEDNEEEDLCKNIANCTHLAASGLPLLEKR